METLENRDKEKPMNEKTREPMVIALWDCLYRFGRNERQSESYV